MNYTEYYNEVNSTADYVVTLAVEALEYDCKVITEDSLRYIIDDCVLHETIDNHQWVIYSSYNLKVIEYSDNEDYMIDELGEDCAIEALKSGGLSGLHQALAYWAFYADVSELLQDKIDEFIDNLDTEE